MARRLTIEEENKQAEERSGKKSSGTSAAALFAKG